MASHGKRLRYVSNPDYENDLESSSAESDAGSSSGHSTGQRRGSIDNKGRHKNLSKNAILARENRLKKKMYVTNLENDFRNLCLRNKKLNSIIDNQSHLIADLKNEVSHLKSALRNSPHLGKLIRSIRQSTGMLVSTSLGQAVSPDNVCVSQPHQPIARKTAHPWEEKIAKGHSESNLDLYTPNATPPSANYDDFELDNLLNGVELDSLMNFDDILMNQNPSSPETKTDDWLQEHNYTSHAHNFRNSDEDDTGVCLHVSKERVSVEFCAICSSQAANAWKH